MIERVLIDNYKCFTNFDWRPKRIALLLGDNGTGKSTAASIVETLASFIGYQAELKRTFPSTTLTKWDKRRSQSFGLDIRRPEGLYTYRLVIEHDPTDRTKSRVQEETLHLEEKRLMSFEAGELHLFRDNGTAGPVVSGDWTRSGLGAIAAGRDNLKLTEFKRWLVEDTWLLKPDPLSMGSKTDEEAERLDSDLANLASWYSEWIRTDIAGAHAVIQALQPLLPGLQSLQVVKNAPLLGATFKVDEGSAFPLFLEDLSDGQRQLIGLYVIRHAILTPGRLVMLDEPDNYVSLREIQPWISEVLDLALAKDGPQIWLTSHHPEVLNQLAPTYGTLFVRLNGGPVRVEPFKGIEGLTSAEVVARGWEP